MQVVLSEVFPVVNVLVMFCKSLGGAVALLAAQNVFEGTLVRRIPIEAPGAMYIG